MYFSTGVIWKGKGKSFLRSKSTILALLLHNEGKFGILYKGRLISILSKRKTFGLHTSFRYVVHLPTGENLMALQHPHHFQIALLLAVKSLTTFTSCGQLTQLFST